MAIDDTTRRMLASREAQEMFLLESDVRGSSDPVIEEMESAGQAQVVASDRLPTQILPAEARTEFEKLGFTFGSPDPDDPLFMPATLPAGWKRKATSESRGSVIVDEHGRNRVTIFYKAAFYDRNAHMALQGLRSYVASHVEYGGPLVITGEWATREAVLAEMRGLREAALEEAAEWRGYAADVTGRTEDNRARCAAGAAEKEGTAAKYAAAMRTLEAGTSDGTCPAAVPTSAQGPEGPANG